MGKCPPDIHCNILTDCSYREEQEKLNVWVAMLNMENTYGTEETLLKVFGRAVQYNDPLKAFQHLVEIYIKSEKYKQKVKNNAFFFFKIVAISLFIMQKIKTAETKKDTKL
ncbi:hypothetical protein AB205_0026370 [Aquarana catesbeiana]|uniref:Uncharacterized protein n=1 Tax=Aquarana catesbeiana TaxID=8400 RepID=A0A2G9SJD1_AQUCT|nr:hypothetical protein AB205_0026370 [Aquarana catesbeiana]